MLYTVTLFAFIQGACSYLIRKKHGKGDAVTQTDLSIIQSNSFCGAYSQSF